MNEVDRGWSTGPTTPALAAIAAVLMVAGCSGGSGPTPPSVPSSPSSPSSSAPASPLPTATGSAGPSGGSPSTAAPSPSGSPQAGGSSSDAEIPGTEIPGTEIPGTGQIRAAVEGFYARYRTSPTRRTGEQYLTDAAVAAVFAPGGDVDRVYCAQNTPLSVSVGAPVVTGDQALVTVTTHWESSPDGHVAVTVALPDILISRITCPA